MANVGIQSAENCNVTQHIGQGTLRESEEAKFLRCLYTSPYQDRKDRNSNRVLGTCGWFVSHPLFQDWDSGKSSPVLFLSADPGCGKSVLAKHLVDDVLPTTNARLVCYFFFKDDFEDQQNILSALCCLLHQLFKKKRVLLSDAVRDQWLTDGEMLTKSFKGLWEILIEVALHDEAGEVVCLLDAIDECQQPGRSIFIKELCRLNSAAGGSRLRFIITGRPTDEIKLAFHPSNYPSVPVINVRGEDAVEVSKISMEIDIFIRARVAEIAERRMLTDEEKDILLKQVMRVDNRTYLWVHLTLELVERDIRINKRQLIESTSNLPDTVDKAYDAILSTSGQIEEGEKILHIIVAAARPLGLDELQVAFNIEDQQSYRDLVVDPQDRFKNYIRNICGLILTISHDSKVYLLHQTVKEFLVSRGEGTTNVKGRNDLVWKQSLHLEQSHFILAQACMKCLLLPECPSFLLRNVCISHDVYISHPIHKYVFLDYSAKNWAAHLRQSKIEAQKAMRESVEKLCHPRLSQVWFKTYWESTNSELTGGFTSLMIGSYFGLTSLVRDWINENADSLDSQDSRYHRSALCWAAKNGFVDVVKLLIKGRKKFPLIPFARHKASLNLSDKFGRTALCYAVIGGYINVTKVLLDAGACVNNEDHMGLTALSYAVCIGNDELINLLLRASPRAVVPDWRELLLSAVGHNDEEVVVLLLNKTDVRAQVNEVGYSGLTSLTLAARLGHAQIVEILLGEGQADPEARDMPGRTALIWAARSGNIKVTEVLLDKGKANPEAKDNNGRTALIWAARSGKTDVVEILFDKGKADPDATDEFGNTALMCAAILGYMQIVEILLDKSEANTEARDNDGQTALMWAAQRGHEGVASMIRRA